MSKFDYNYTVSAPLFPSRKTPVKTWKSWLNRWLIGERWRQFSKRRTYLQEKNIKIAKTAAPVGGVWRSQRQLTATNLDDTTWISMEWYALRRYPPAFCLTQPVWWHASNSFTARGWPYSSSVETHSARRRSGKQTQLFDVQRVPSLDMCRQYLQSKSSAVYSYSVVSTVPVFP